MLPDAALLSLARAAPATAEGVLAALPPAPDSPSGSDAAGPCACPYPAAVAADAGQVAALLRAAGEGRCRWASPALEEVLRGGSRTAPGMAEHKAKNRQRRVRGRASSLKVLQGCYNHEGI